MKQWQKGSAGADFIWFFGLMILLFIIWVFTGGPDRSSSQSPFISAPTVLTSDSSSSGGSYDLDVVGETSSGQIIEVAGRVYVRSPFLGQVTIDDGNAQREDSARDEYIVLNVNRNVTNPISITGWKLENGDKFKKFDAGGGKLKQGISASAIIPGGINVLVSGQKQVPAPIVLNAGDKVIVTSGTLPILDDVTIKNSFRTNICSGYIEKLNRNDFNPALSIKCPYPEEEVDIGLPNSCYEFIEDMDRCHTPVTDRYFDFDGDVLKNHVDGYTHLSKSCRDFVVETYSYNSCVARHSSDDDFLQPEWRVFLNRNFEMWTENREIISLFDNQGRLVDQIGY